MRAGRRMVILGVVLAFFLVGVLRPSPARADVEDDLILAGVALGAYVAFVVVMTAVIYGGGPFDFDDTEPRELDKASERAPFPVPGDRETQVHLGVGCAQRSTQLTIACW